jgi:hypothetical protein
VFRQLKITRRRATHKRLTPRKNDPHKLRRLRRPTGPRRAWMCEVLNKIL